MTNEVLALAMDLSFSFSGARLIFLRFGKVEQPVLRLILIIFSWGVCSSEKKTTTLLRNRKSEESEQRKSENPVLLLLLFRLYAWAVCKEFRLCLRLNVIG